MKSVFGGDKHGSILRIELATIGIVINVLLAFLTNSYNLPVFLDTVGTILVSFIAGALPGAATAIVSNAIGVSFNGVSMYFSVINVLTALITANFARFYISRDFKKIVKFILVLGVLSGFISSFLQWHLFNGPQNDFISTASRDLAVATKLPQFVTFGFVNLLVHTLDKGFSAGIALNLVFFIPQRIKEDIKNSLRKQAPLSEEEIKSLRDWSKEVRYSMRVRLTMLLFTVSIMVILLMGGIELRLYFVKDIKEKENIAMNAAKFAASVIAPKNVDEYLKKGELAIGYNETEDMLYRIRDNALGVAYLYAVRVDDLEHVTFIFDLDAVSTYQGYGILDDTEGYEHGTQVDVEEAFLPYMQDLLDGKEIPAIEANDKWSWMITAYYPVRDEKGNTVCYAGADISIDYMTDYLVDFMWAIMSIMAGIIIVILTYGMWSTNTYLVYPLTSIGRGVENFIKAGDDQKKIDKAVRELRRIDIQTNDEVEKLYKSVCDMALNQAEQIRSIRRFSESTARMQDGLIVTMADLVEKRDANSSSHTQKTTAYAKIIAEGLLRKGYYLGKVNQKFISDVVRSAPLHDIGKINVPDSVLNKSGELTTEEYEIIKSHTTAGKVIMENAITTVSGENYLKEARNMAAYHHERWDGKGYPEGLHGEVIPLSARIMAVADQFDVLTSARGNDKQYTFEEAVAQLEEGAGTKFDPKCVEVFVDALPEVKVVFRKYNKNQ